MEELIKQCTKCKLNQPIEKYRAYSDSSHSNTCKSCANEMDKIRKIKARKIKSETVLAKCEKCNEEKALKHFSKLKKFYKKKICISCYPIFLTEQKNEWCRNERACNANYRIKKSARLSCSCSSRSGSRIRIRRQLSSMVES